MDIHEGDRVIVNLAPFIGSSVPSKHVVTCRVITIHDETVEVATEPPYRSLKLEISRGWVSWVEAEDGELLRTVG